jgi:hypothetical protein
MIWDDNGKLELVEGDNDFVRGSDCPTAYHNTLVEITLDMCSMTLSPTTRDVPTSTPCTMPASTSTLKYET